MRSNLGFLVFLIYSWFLQIKLGDEGWKERYYAEKFEAKSEDERDTIRRNAVHGLMLLFSIVGVVCAVLHM